jgi:hypothetical protein
VSLPAGAAGPEPFNENDVNTREALICKYICSKNKDTFNRIDFLQSAINDESLKVEAYDTIEIQNAIKDERNIFNNLISYCLEKLRSKDLLEKQDKLGQDKHNLTHNDIKSTQRLKVLCPEILKYDMPFIDALIGAVAEAEKEIHQDKDFKEITTLLKHLEDGSTINKAEAISSININTNTLDKLIQVGVLTSSLNNEISISPIGKKVVLDLSNSL